MFGRVFLLSLLLHGGVLLLPGVGVGSSGPSWKVLPPVMPQQPPVRVTWTSVAMPVEEVAPSEAVVEVSPQGEAAPVEHVAMPQPAPGLRRVAARKAVKRAPVASEEVSDAPGVGASPVPVEAPLPAVRRETVQLGVEPVRDLNLRFYLEAWQSKVERYGALAWNGRDVGRLKLSLVLSAQGEVTAIRLIQGSGVDALDRFAAQMVRAAGPYARFTPAMRERMDELEIVRVYSFEKG